MNKIFGNAFKAIKLAGYRNINELYEQTDQLHACETLFGDWNAELLILAQDASNFKSLENIYNVDNTNPYRHNPKNRTNVNLFEILNSTNKFNLGTYENPNNRNCGIYYANAIWLLKDSSSMSGAITSKNEAYKKNAPVFEATLGNLQELKLIITLGEHSYNFINFFFENQINLSWHKSVTSGKIHKVKHNKQIYLIASIYHTSTRGMLARARLDGFTGKNSCAKGLELTKQDLQNAINDLVA